MLKDRTWYANQTGTRYVRDKPKPSPKRDRDPEVGKKLVALLTTEAQGDADLAILLAIRNLLSSPAHWHPKLRACSVEGSTEPTSPTARKWSLFGAVERITTPGLEGRRRTILKLVKAAIPKSDQDSQSLMHWEPEQEHSKILWVLNMAIANRKKELGYL